MGKLNWDQPVRDKSSLELGNKDQMTTPLKYGVLGRVYSRTMMKFATIVVAGGLLAGCVTTSTSAPDPTRPVTVAENNTDTVDAMDQGVNDPLEPLNRVFFEFNRGLDTLVLRPVSIMYRGFIPPPIRNIIHNFLNNLKTPVVLLNDLLQGNGARASDTLARFAINSTVGVLGFGDPATNMGFKRHSEDFGQTLGAWGMGEGMYLVLPIFGPSNPRDAVGKVVDTLTDPIWNYAQNTNSGYITNERFAAELVDFRARNMDEINDLERTSLDYYAAVRNLYRQVRIDAIRNGHAPTNSALPAMSLNDIVNGNPYAMSNMDNMSDPDMQNESLATKK